MDLNLIDPGLGGLSKPAKNFKHEEEAMAFNRRLRDEIKLFFGKPLPCTDG